MRALYVPGKRFGSCVFVIGYKIMQGNLRCITEGKQDKKEAC